MAGLVETLPVLKIGVGTELRGRGGGSFGSWVGCLTPFLFLPGPIHQPSHPLLTLKRRPWRGRDWPAVPVPGGMVPDGRLFSSCFKQVFLSLTLGAHRAWELLGPDVVGLPECRPAGEDPDLSQLAFQSHAFPLLVSPPLLTCPSVAPLTVCGEGEQGLTQDRPQERGLKDLGPFSALPQGRAEAAKVEAGPWF
ncbi:hypothetical protein Cadr_000016077 [Camelus dromedarius]|uniref:Uncharacterized protein n=1 Tax=Camelus dromedarius TaxID=9838 RepID=A0A5N4E9Y3_CAMDR|nr:hypothetical protein Cadr_000016077 [Camelus dromedarius]